MQNIAQQLIVIMFLLMMKTVPKHTPVRSAGNNIVPIALCDIQTVCHAKMLHTAIKQPLNGYNNILNDAQTAM